MPGVPDGAIGAGETALLVAGALILLGVAFVVARVLRSLRHGFSIRLQLFLAIALTSMLTTGVIGLWAVDRLEVRAEQLMLDYGPSEALVELIRGFGPKMAVLVAIVGVTAAAAAFALGRGLAQPLERLTQVAEAIARGERHAVLPPPVGREVRRLTAAFDSMRRALEDRHHMERFVADLSHELKNPVSAIRAATEVLLEGAAQDEAARPRFLARIDEASKRLEALLQDLLALARLEAAGLGTDAGAVDFDDVVRASIGGQTAAIEARHLAIVADLPPLRVRGSARWLQRAVDNLLSNAIRYSPEGGRVELRLTADDGEAVLRVRDHGPGVAPALRDRLFERFASDRAGDGTGLGLAIVRSVAEHHGGSARHLPHEGPGALFELRVRLA